MMAARARHGARAGRPRGAAGSRHRAAAAALPAAAVATAATAAAAQEVRETLCALDSALRSLGTVYLKQPNRIV